MKKLIVIGIPALIVFMILLSSFEIIDASERGVVLRLGAVNRVLSEGLNYVNPFTEDVVVFNIRTVKRETTALAYSKDTQVVDSKVVLNYHLKADDVGNLYREVGRDYASVIIDPAVQESVKAVVAKFSASELTDQRPTVKDEIQVALAERLSQYYIQVDEVSITDLSFSDTYEAAIEAKQKAQQEALKAENDLKRVKLEAEQRVAQAKAEAEAIRIQAQAINSQGGADYVNLKAIEKWNGILPAQFVPGSAVPFINI